MRDQRLAALHRPSEQPRVFPADHMKKLLIIGLSSAALLAAIHADLSFAETNDNTAPVQSGSKTDPTAQAQRSGPSDNQIANDVDARIAKLKADLQLTSDQEKNWSGLQTVLHDHGVGELKNLSGGRSSHMDRDNQSQRNDIVMMRDEAAELNSKAASLKKLADAAEPLYGSLDDRQKHKLVQFMKIEVEHD
jgi:hypothetical protein